MKVTKPAILGGKPLRAKPFPQYNTIGKQEEAAAVRVIRRGVLSGFLGRYSPGFWGGPEVRALESAWQEQFGVKHAVAFNSATNAIYAAVGASNIDPGDEVIVSPYSMCISATAPLAYNAVPVFADVEPEYFCIDPSDIKKKLTPRTRAIITVDILGQPCDMRAISSIAKANGLFVISDSAQAAGTVCQGRRTGSLADITIFSLNVHKIIQTGEGGVLTTNDDRLAMRARLIRNHAESIIEDLGVEKAGLKNMLGRNDRMCEVEAAMAQEQLKKLPKLLSRRQELAVYLAKQLSGMLGITPPKVRSGCTHGYYQFGMLYDEKALGLPREVFVKALVAEGLPINPLHANGYVKPLYRHPIFHNMMVFGKGYPFRCHPKWPDFNYRETHCPVVEELYKKRMLVINQVYPPLTFADMDDIRDMFVKVVESRSEIAQALSAGKVKL